MIPEPKTGREPQGEAPPLAPPGRRLREASLAAPEIAILRRNPPMQNLGRPGQIESQAKRRGAGGGDDRRLDDAPRFLRIQLGEKPARLDPALAGQERPPELLHRRSGNRLPLAVLIDIAELDAEPSVERGRIAHERCASDRNQPTNQGGRSPSTPSSQDNPVAHPDRSARDLDRAGARDGSRQRHQAQARTRNLKISRCDPPNGAFLRAGNNLGSFQHLSKNPSRPKSALRWLLGAKRRRAEAGQQCTRPGIHGDAAAFPKVHLGGAAAQ